MKNNINYIPSYLLTLSIIGLTGCIALHKHKHVVDIPFIPQKQLNHCGVTCLEMAFQFFNIEYQQNSLIEEAYIPALSGSPPELLVDVAVRYGLTAHTVLLKTDGLREALSNGKIPIVFFPPANDDIIGHFVLITGVPISGKALIAHDGTHRHKTLPVPNDYIFTILLDTNNNSAPNL